MCRLLVIWVRIIQHVTDAVKLAVRDWPLLSISLFLLLVKMQQNFGRTYDTSSSAELIIPVDDREHYPTIIVKELLWPKSPHVVQLCRLLGLWLKFHQQGYFGYVVGFFSSL